MTSAMLDKAQNLRMIQMPGVGYEHIDVAACQARSIPVAITPEGTVQGVAEHTVMMVLALYKHLVEAHTALAQGRWIHNQLRHIALMLEDKRVGMGRIGREVARRLQGWGVDLVYTDLRPLPADVELALGASWLELDELLRTSDVVSLHVYLTETSRHMIGEREFGLMQRSAILINTSRGEVVDEAALYRALRDRQIQGAVFLFLAADRSARVTGQMLMGRQGLQRVPLMTSTESLRLAYRHRARRSFGQDHTASGAITQGGIPNVVA